MKAIVANIILGSVFMAALRELPASANVSPDKKKHNSQRSAIVSANALNYLNGFILPPAFFFGRQQFDYSISPQDKDNIKKIIRQDRKKVDREFSNIAAEGNNKNISFLKRKPFLNGSDRENIVVGKHGVFWHDKSNQKHWGLTTVKTWGDTKAELSLESINYLNSAPVLAPGTSTLTVSGGSQFNLIKPSTLLEDINDFQGGVAFHQSLAQELTVGLGIVYEDYLQGFSQFTYQPENFPLRTTVSLLHGKEGLEIYSHLRLQPSENIMLNFFSDEKNQKFDFNWGLASGLTITADGNSKTDSLRAGAQLNLKNELFSLFAKAQLDNNNKLQWEVNSELGNLQLKYSTNTKRINTKMEYKFGDISDSGINCSFWFQNQIHQRRKDEDNLAVWGWNINSASKLNNRPIWQFSLGYGYGSAGEGAIALLETAIDSSVSLKLSYESISLSSDDTRLKLQLNSH